MCVCCMLESDEPSVRGNTVCTCLLCIRHAFRVEVLRSRPLLRKGGVKTGIRLECACSG